MYQKKIAVIIVLAISLCFAVLSCRNTVRYTQATGSEYKAKQNGPPPHAPAHGYRHKHSDGVELVYQSSLGVYSVAGSSDLYFCSGQFYRLQENSWQISVHVGGPWKPVNAKKLPPGLKKRKSNKHAMK